MYVCMGAWVHVSWDVCMGACVMARVHGCMGRVHGCMGAWHVCMGACMGRVHGCMCHGMCAWVHAWVVCMGAWVMCMGAWVHAWVMACVSPWLPIYQLYLGHVVAMCLLTDQELPY